MVAIRTPDEEEQPRMSLAGPGGFANPPRPIPVALARDEEAAGIESEATKFPPPAYGLWRESVVCITDIYLEAEFTNQFAESRPKSHLLAAYGGSKGPRSTTSRNSRNRSWDSEAPVLCL